MVEFLPRLAWATVSQSTVLTVDWVLRASGEYIKGQDVWQPLLAADLHTHLASGRKSVLLTLLHGLQLVMIRK